VLSSTNGDDLTVAATSTGGTATNALTTLNPAVGATATSSGPDSTTGAGGVITRAQSAILYVDGLQVTSDSNTVTTAVDGLTLNLVSAQSSADLLAGKTVDITVGVDKGTVKSNVQKFVDAYNGLISTVGQLSAVVPVTNGTPVAGPLVGDVTVRGLMSGIRGELVKMTGPDGARALAELGITTQKDGTLKIDDTTLSAALDSNFEGVAEYFSGSNGLMTRLESNVGNYLKSDGVLDQRTKSLSGTLANIDDQREALDMRIEKVQARLVAQYSAMDSLVARLQKTSESLTSQLASLPGFVKKD
jgi:flagellar hook-associated protein 2